MNELNLKDSINSVKKYSKMTPKEREPLQKQRFYSLVTWARKHNKLYAEHFKDLGVNFFMRDVPYIERDYLISHMEQWKSDETVEIAASQAINTVRSFSFDRDYRSFLLHGSRAVIISGSDGSGQMAAWSKTTTVVSVFLPIEELVDQLNSLKPALLWAYPSTLEQLIEYKKNGSLSIKPVLIIAGGEYLSDNLRAKLIDTFKSTVQATYTSTEFGIAASECQFGHLHVNDDWIILEAVNSKGKPCMEGETPDKILVTNMYKTDYPVIRMTLPDNVRFHSRPCDCGNPSPCISIVSSKDNSISFESANGNIDIHTSEFSKVFGEISGINSFQILVYPNNNISIRLSVSDDNMKSFLFLQAEQNLRRFLREKGILASAITMDADAPLQDEIDGKLKNVIDCR